MGSKKINKSELIRKINKTNLSDQDKEEVIEFIISAKQDDGNLLNKSIALYKAGEIINDLLEKIGNSS